MKSNNIIIFFIFLFLIKSNKTFPKNKEAVFNTASSIVKHIPTQKDSTLTLKKYTRALKLYEKQEYSKSLKLSLKLKSEIEKNKDDDLLFLTNYLIGNIFYKTRSFKKSVKYFRKSLLCFNFEKLEKNRISHLYSINENNIQVNDNFLKLGGSYHKLYEIDSSKVYKDSTLYYYDKVLSFSALSDKAKDLRAKVHINYSIIYLNDSLFDKAKESIKKAITIYEKMNNKVAESAAYGNFANIFLSENNFKKAKELYLVGVKLIKNDESQTAIRYKSSLYFNLAWAMRNLKDYKAYDFQEMSYDIEDNLRDKEFRGIIDEINAEYDVDAAKKLVLKEEENKRLKAQTTFWFFGIAGFLVILSLLYFLNYYKLRQKNLSLKLSENELLQNQKIEKLRSDSQARILNATIDGKESERKEIAETLHDNVSALLSSANLHLQACKTQFNGKTPLEIDKTKEIITEASQKIRDLSHTLVSSVLLKFGLHYAIKDMAEKYSNSQLQFETEIGDLRRYHQKFEIKTYNIIQELVNNILKHSNAKKAIIGLREKKGIICLNISDDGQGFDKTTITKKDGLGINQIEARIQIMKGEFHIDSEEGKGTKIEVELPILEKEVLVI